MRLKFIAAGILAAASFSASAGDQVINVSADGSAHAFNAVVGNGILSGGLDEIFLNGLGAGKYNIGLSITGQQLSFNALKSNLNGKLGESLSIGSLRFFGVEYTGVGPFKLQLYGNALAGGNYSGTYSVSAVPEPATYGMLLGGLGLLGFMARRRAAKKAA
ncbi:MULTISPECIES: FxDxF family PEP-CTERM protein [unclassified Janthinobacterium]|uniref:FxDxF family PEP-CTERM protein n=1 Tax=unclassified Janthinobacterium TaxID=2610881 RepID=UPI001C596A24|nr:MULTISPECIES: FxDxF family PEP-CTERM protein [unclassified Janthinobacterium]QYG09163.1 FxDxF family PEP-CTERM protein [Janthinobacterium sp. PAMC25594]